MAIVGYDLTFVAGSHMALLVPGSVLSALASLPISYLGGLIIMDLVGALTVCDFYLGRLNKKMPEIEADLNKWKELNAK